jgi:hypothetical protein
VQFALRGGFTNADCDTLIDGWERALARDEAFAAILLSDAAEEADAEKGARPRYAVWVKANRERIATRCKALAYLHDGPDDPKARAASENMLGCPVRHYPPDQRQAAIAWLTGCVSAATLTDISGDAEQSPA